MKAWIVLFRYFSGDKFILVSCHLRIIKYHWFYLGTSIVHEQNEIFLRFSHIVKRLSDRTR